MKKIIKTLFAISAVLTFAFSFSGCKDKKTSALNSQRAIRLGDQPNYLPLKVAVEKGFFTKEFGSDYTFELATFVHGPAINEAFIAGHLDFAQLGDSPIVQAVANDVDLKIVSSFWTSDKAYALVNRKDSPLKDLSTLKGTKIGYRPGTNEHKLVLRFLTSQNLTTKDVTLVNVPQADSLATLSRGDIDGVIAVQPNIENIAESVGGEVIAYNKDYYTVATYNAILNKFGKENPDTVARILKVLQETEDWISKNEEEAFEIVAARVGTNTDKVKQYWKSRTWSTGWTENLYAEVQDTADFALSQKTISRSIKAKDFIDTSYLKKAGLPVN